MKWIKHGDIEDPSHVQQVLAKMRGEDVTASDPEYIARTFGDQINATKAVEYSR